MAVGAVPEAHLAAAAENDGIVDCLVCLAGRASVEAESIRPDSTSRYARRTSRSPHRAVEGS